MFKYAALANIATKLLIYKYKDRRTGKTYTQIGFNTVRHSYFTLLAKLFYKNKKKIVPKNILMNTNIVTLAIFIADDGTYDPSSKTIKISVDNYSYKDRLIIKHWLRKKFNIDSSIEKDRIYILRKDYPKLVHLVSKYFPYSMRYKLGYFAVL